jgi:hypothetical protein
VSARRRNDPLAALSTRERAVLALMAEGRSNAGLSTRPHYAFVAGLATAIGAEFSTLVHVSTVQVK